MRKNLLRTMVSIGLCFSLLISGCSSPSESVAIESTRELDNSCQLKVVHRLRQVGFSEEDALARSARMSQEELAYFAEHPEAIKRTGFIILGALFGSTTVAAATENQPKEVHHYHHD